MFLAGLCGLVLFVGNLPAFETLGVIKKVDVEKGVLHVHAGGQDRMVKIDKDAPILGKDDKPLPDGLKSGELKEGAEVTLTIEFNDGNPLIKGIRLGKRPGAAPPPKEGGKTLEAAGVIKKVDVENGEVIAYAGGQDRSLKIGKDARVLDKDDKPLPDGFKSSELKEGVEVTLTIEPVEGGPVIKTIRLGKRPGATNPPKDGGKPSVGLKPLTEMTATDTYKGEDGGLYGGGKNEPPPGHLKAAKQESARIQPLNEDGKPAQDGKIGLVSISMSNATQEFSLFKQLADKDADKSAAVAVVDCAQGGQAMAQWVDPRAKAWIETDRRLTMARVDPKQVQVIWVKLANMGPMGELTDHGKKLEKDTLAVVQNARARFPNLRIAYLSSRIYAGYANSRLNPEPYAYEGAYVVRWLIQDQIKGNAELNYRPETGAVKAPLLLWGPYLWADGVTARKSDGLVYERQDLAVDGTHPSERGRRKVADLILNFFKTDPLARVWFVKEGRTTPPRKDSESK
jgi:Cu/Ag efflux protein CusF